MRDGRLERIEAVVQWQQGMLPEGDDDRLFRKRQHHGFRVLGAGGHVGHRAALLPLGDGLRVDPIALGQGSQARLTMLYRSTAALYLSIARRDEAGEAEGGGQPAFA